jgi:hypothetical protein
MPFGRFGMSLMFVVFGLACGSSGAQGEVRIATPRVLEDTRTQAVVRRAAEVQWSRDGRAVAWIEMDGEGRALGVRVGDVATGETRDLDCAGDPLAMTFAPDGMSVAIVARVGGRDRLELWSVADAVPRSGFDHTPAKPEARRHTLPARVEGPVRFSADGTAVVWSEALIDANAKNAPLHVLDVHTFRHEVRPGAISRASWVAPSRDGRSVIRVAL